MLRKIGEKVERALFSRSAVPRPFVEQLEGRRMLDGVTGEAVLAQEGGTAPIVVESVEATPVLVRVTPAVLEVRYGDDPALSTFSVEVTHDGEAVEAGEVALVSADMSYEEWRAPREVVGGEVVLGGKYPGHYQYVIKYIDPVSGAVGVSNTFDLVVHKALTMTAAEIVGNWWPKLEVEIRGAGGGALPVTVINGTVTFKEGESVLSIADLEAGRATLDLSWWTPGERVITAIYSGDGALDASEATVRMVDRGPVRPTLEVPAGKFVTGEAVTLTAQVRAEDPEAGPVGGMVAFYFEATDSRYTGAMLMSYLGGIVRVNDALLGTSMLDGDGVARLQTTALPPGARVRAAYLGLRMPLWKPGFSEPAIVAPASEFESGESEAMVVGVVEKTQLALTVFGPATPTHPPTIAASVQLPDWNWPINFNSGGGSGPYYVHPKVEERGSIGWNSAMVSIHVPRPQPQPVWMPPVSSGGGGGNGSESHAVFIFSNPLPKPVARSGMVKFMLDGVVVAEVPVGADGNAYYTPRSITLGEHEFTAEYSGDSNYGASRAAAAKVEMSKTQTKTNLGATRKVMNQGGWVTFRSEVGTATKDFVRPGGWVMLMTGDRKLAKVRLGAKIKVLDLNLAVGVHRIRAIYLGDENCERSESGLFKLRVKAGR